MQTYGNDPLSPPTMQVAMESFSLVSTQALLISHRTRLPKLHAVLPESPGSCQTAISVSYPQCKIFDRRIKFQQLNFFTCAIPQKGTHVYDLWAYSTITFLDC